MSAAALSIVECPTESLWCHEPGHRLDAETQVFFMDNDWIVEMPTVRFAPRSSGACVVLAEQTGQPERPSLFGTDRRAGHGC
jgi:hypothetical protein